MDMLATGLSWLTSQLAAYASQIVTYEVGPDSIQVHATFGQKLLKLVDEYGGMRLEWSDMDFLIPSADLALNGIPFEPERGHRITVPFSGKIQTYEILPYGDEGPVRLSDPHGSMFRVHTKLISVEQVTP